MTSIPVDGAGKRVDLPGPRPVWLMAAAILVVVGVALVRDPVLVRFWPFTAGEFVQTILPFLIVAFVIERALEIIVKGFYGQGEAILKRAAKLNPEAEAAVTEYKEHTRRFAFTAAVLIGIAIAAVGLRMLEQLADPGQFGRLTNVQRIVFQTVDVLLTGTLLAGGADTFHKLVSLVTNTLDLKNDALKKASP